MRWLMRLFMAERLTRLAGAILSVIFLLLAGALLWYTDEDPSMYGCPGSGAVYCPEYGK